MAFRDGMTANPAFFDPALPGHVPLFTPFNWTFDHSKRELMQFTEAMLERFDDGKVAAMLCR